KLMSAWNGFDSDGTMFGDAATGNRVAGTFMKGVQEWETTARFGMAALYCKEEYDWVGCRIGLRRYHTNSSIEWAASSGAKNAIIDDLNGWAAPTNPDPAYIGWTLRTGSPW